MKLMNVEIPGSVLRGSFLMAVVAPVHVAVGVLHVGVLLRVPSGMVLRLTVRRGADRPRAREISRDSRPNQRRFRWA